MKKILAIAIFFILSFSQSNAAEKIYCLDINGDFNYIDYKTRIHYAYQYNKDSVKQCKDRNKFDSSNEKNLIEISKEFYNSSHFQKNIFPKQIDSKKLKQVANQYGINLNSNSSSSIINCTDELEYTWLIDGNYAKFEFTSNSEKPINISKIFIKTNDKKTVLEEKVSLNLKPFGLNSTSVYIGDRNKSAIQRGGYLCSYGSKVKKASNNNRENNGWFKWWYVLVGLLILGVLGNIIDGMNKPKPKMARPASVSTSQKNIDDGFIFSFVRGNETLGKTFWLYFVLGNVVLNIIGLIIGDPLYKRESTFLLYFYIFISLAWNILATIGVFKSADNYKIQKKKLNQSYGYATAAKVAVVILILSAIGNAI